MTQCNKYYSIASNQLVGNQSMLHIPLPLYSVQHSENFIYSAVQVVLGYKKNIIAFQML